MAVVDSKARVFGVEGLRVVDASSFVFTPPGHTQGYTCEGFSCPLETGADVSDRCTCREVGGRYQERRVRAMVSFGAQSVMGHSK